MARQQKDFKALTELFKSRFLRRVAEDNYSNILSEVLVSYGSIADFVHLRKLSSLFKKAYRLVSSNCTYEYVYKNTILNDIFLKYHDFSSAFYTTEFFCGQSKADIAIFNGFSSAYEIKTKFDNLEKLEKQILDYKKVFSKVNVVADERHIANIEKLTDNNVGILLLENAGHISEIRHAHVDFSYIDNSSLFDCLHKNEYKKIIYELVGKNFDFPNALEYSKYKQFFMEIPSDIALEKTIAQLRMRTLPLSRLCLLEKAPSCLYQVILDSNLTSPMATSIVAKINKPFAIA